MVELFANSGDPDQTPHSRILRALVALDVTYAIVKVYVTERNDIIKHHSNVIAIWSAIEVNALLTNLRSEMKGVQE